MNLFEVIREVTPRRIINLVPASMVESLSEKRFRRLPSFKYLEDLMQRYRVNSLVHETPETLRTRIDEFMQMRDHVIEGYSDPDKQRDTSIKFEWGHDHDFGSFSLSGNQGNRHVRHLSVFVDEFRALSRDLSGKKVLDIGCWTGGSSLLLAAMGADVVAIEEVKKYVDCLSFLRNAFNISQLQAQNKSLYECTGEEYIDAFDYVLFAGVLYHVTDPVLALRICFNSLKKGGRCLIETHASTSSRCMLTYEGPSKTTRGSKDEQNRGGWNWFFPSREALRKMMTDVGFMDVRVGKLKFGRVYAVGTKESHVDMTRAGLSSRHIQ